MRESKSTSSHEKSKFLEWITNAFLKTAPLAAKHLNSVQRVACVRRTEG